MNLRPYQAECISAAQEHLKDRLSTLAVLPTGMGKTVIFSHLANVWPGRVLVVAHRDELIQQAAEKLRVITGESVGIEMGQCRVDEGGWLKTRLVVTSVQTMCREKRQKKFDPSSFGLVVIDEAHHAVARTYQDVIAYFRQSPTMRVFGVTATPNRADELALGQVFESVCFNYSIEDAVNDGWLVPVRQQAIQVEGLDFSKCRTLAGDFSTGELEEILEVERTLHAVASPTVELAAGRPTLLFAASVSHARKLAQVIDRYRKDQVVVLDGSTDAEVRRREVERFKRGEIQFLCNCSLFLEGFDAPSTAVVVMARPTKSLALYTQVLGRGTRPLPGIVDGPESPEARRAAILGSAKPDMLVIDFVGNSGRHKIVTAADLLGGKYDEQARQYARETVEEEGDSPLVADSLERARDELALIEEQKEMAAQARREREQATRLEEDERMRKITGKADYVAHDVDPFSGGPRYSAPTQGGGPEMATDKQVNYLVYRANWDRGTAQRLTKRQAMGVIGKHKSAEAVS